MKTKDLVVCSLFVALIAAGTFIKIPIPYIPITLQTFFTTLAGLLLGGELGFVSVFVYIALGLAGVPVFAHGGGIGYVFQPSFGYIIGFAVGAYVTGKIANNTETPSIKRLMCANFSGLAIIYIFGLIYYYLISKFYLCNPIGIWPLFLYCFLLTVPGDILLCILAAFIGKRLIPVVGFKASHKKE